MKQILKIAVAYLFISLSLIPSAKAQEIYVTNEGDIGIIGGYKGNPVIANSTSLYARINYTTAEIELSLNTRTLSNTGTDTNSLRFINFFNGIITLKGKINIRYINTLSHPAQKLNFPADFQVNGVIKSLYITGTLQHIASNGNYSCLLILNWSFRLGDFGIMVPEGYADQVNVSLKQSILKRKAQ